MIVYHRIAPLYQSNNVAPPELLPIVGWQLNGSGVKPFSIHPTILNLTLATPPSITNIAKGAVDIIVPSSWPMTDKEWDLLEEAVNALDGTWSRGDSAGGISSDIGTVSPSPLGAEGKIVICECVSSSSLEQV